MSREALEDCPICQAVRAVERLAQGWRHCNSCSKEFQVDAAGAVVKVYTRDPDRWMRGRYET